MELVRGLNPVKLKGNWKQAEFLNQATREGTATVRFQIAAGVFMERFVDDIIIHKKDGSRETRRANFIGKHKGLYFQPANMMIEAGDEVWIVEGCIDALSLWSIGIKAVACLSSGNYPTKLFKEYADRDITWVWALDNDNAGRKSMLEHHKRLNDTGETSEAALPPHGRKKHDWNDLFLRDKLKDDNIDYYRYLGALHIAPSAFEKALLIWKRKQINGFDFTFRKRTYWFSLDWAKFQSALETLREKDHLDPSELDTQRRAIRISGGLEEIANCETTFLYFLANKLTDESWYYARVEFPHSGAPVKSTFTGGQLSTGSEYKKRLLSIAPGAVFTGNSNQLNHLIKDKLFALKVVETVDYIGYSKEHEAYIFNNHAVSNGTVYNLNDEDFFEIDKLSIKSLSNTPNLSIGAADSYENSWKEQYWTAFGNKGLVTLAFWIGSLFAEQIRKKQKSYPFLELVGEAGSGKTTLLEFLWRLVGRDEWEGFDPSKSTLAARSRIFSQVSNLPIVMIESERETDTAKARAFDWEEMKTAFNGRAVRSRGIKNNGNDTYEPPFRGSLVIAQNAEVNGSDAILSRIVHVNLDRKGHSYEGKAAADHLSQVPIEHISHFLLNTIKSEKKILDHFFKEAPRYEAQLFADDQIRTPRIAKNHGQILALVDMAAKMLGISETDLRGARDFVVDIARDREKAICADHSTVQNFWDIYDYLLSSNKSLHLNHTHQDGIIAINLPQIVREAGDRKQSLAEMIDLKRHLKTSRKRKFVGIKTIRSQVWDDKTVKCWIFKEEA